MDSADSDPNRSAVQQRLGAAAFIAAEGANCLYKPEADSAVRIVPPRGDEVTVLRERDNWVLIRWSGKEAWSPRANLSPIPRQFRTAVEVGATPRFCKEHGEPLSELQYLPLNSFAPRVEVGPRGGRYVRTASGFRRYL